MVNVNETYVGLLGLPSCLNSILGGTKQTKGSKGKEFVKEIMDENDESSHMEKLPQQMPNSKYLKKKNLRCRR